MCLEEIRRCINNQLPAFDNIWELSSTEAETNNQGLVSFWLDFKQLIMAHGVPLTAMRGRSRRNTQEKEK